MHFSRALEASRHGIVAARRWLAMLILLAGAASGGGFAADYPEVVPGRAVRLPADHGSHPAYRTEWWYVTGWLRAEGRDIGFQVTFFRSRRAEHDANPSSFAPRQLIIAHAALSDPKEGRLLHDERVVREGFGLAGAEQGRTNVWIDDWRLEETRAGLRAVIPARDFRLELRFGRDQAPLQQGEAGYSRKGPDPLAASYYYSLPHLEVEGVLERSGRKVAVTGSAWMDHEWSSKVLDERAAGWDWTGINLEDGSALMAFRIRAKDGGVLWAGGTLRGPGGPPRAFGPDEVAFEPLRRWRSPRTGAEYPVAVRISVGETVIELEPLMDDQENDARASTGAVYYEGAVRALRDGAEIGRGYLELTGYWRAMRL